MNIEEVREYLLSLPGVKETLFAEDWVNFSIGGKWFAVYWFNAPEQRIAVKIDPDEAIDLRDQFNGITPAYHLNKRHWSDLYLDSDLPDEEISRLRRGSYNLVLRKLPKALRQNYHELP